MSVPSRARVALLTLALACTGAAGLAPTALAGKNLEIAVQDDTALLGRGPAVRDRALDAARGMGATRVRVNVIWSRVLSPAQANATTVPAAPSYDWAAYDGLIDAAAARGIRVQMTLMGPAPRFATANHALGGYKPNATYFARFARDTATHFRGRVNRYSIWNEPNYRGWIEPHKSSPALYRKLYTAGYSAIKVYSPGTQVLLGETAPNNDRNTIGPIAWLRSLTCVNAKYKRGRCKPLAADGFADHPYDYLRAPNVDRPGADDATMASVDELGKALAKLKAARVLRTPAGGTVPVYLTEYGYHTSESGKKGTADSKRAAYLTR